MRTKDKITSALLCIVLVSAYLLLFSFYISHVRNMSTAETNTRLVEVAEHAAEITTLKVSSDLYTLSAIANLMSKDGYLGYDYYMEYLSSEVPRNDFKAMGIVEPNGVVYMSDGTTIKLDQASKDYFFNVSSNEATITNALIDSVDGKKIVVCSVPIYDDGKVVASLLASNNVDLLKEKLSITTYEGKGSTFVITSEGEPIVLSDLFEEDEYFDNIFNYIWGENGYKTSEMSKSFYDNMQNGMGGTFVYTAPLGTKYLSYQPVGMNGWYSCTVVEESYVKQKADKIVSFTFLLEVASVALIILFMLYIIMQKTRSNKELKILAFIDKVTGFGNWNKLRDDIRYLFRGNPNDSYAMVILDVDDFKVVNDLYGHIRGNEILVAIANAVNGYIEPGETFARNTADNFNVLLKYTTTQNIIDRVTELSDLIISNPVCCRIKLSFGIYIIDDQALSPSIISDRAQLAKKSIKGRVDKNYAFYDGQVRDQLILERGIESEMEHALETNQFKMYLQPKICIADNTLSGAEALVRWCHPTKGIIPPFMFIPLFERNGFITKLDMYMFEQACKFLKDNDHRCTRISRGELTVSVNLSRIHLNNPYLVEDLYAITKKYGVHPHSMEIELTESAVFENIDKLVSIMQRLKEKGFKISIDDFGSGYSSLNLLKDIPTDILKIDKEFLGEATDSGRGKTIIKSIVQMANELNIQTVAEGVETKEQVEFLLNIGCDIAQGYYYAKPMPIDDFIEKAEEIHNNN